jgi:cell division protein FtsI (penicillin-binding protein 3)
MTPDVDGTIKRMLRSGALTLVVVVGAGGLCAEIVRRSLSTPAVIRPLAIEADATAERRGDLLDRAGRILATDVAVITLEADRARLTDPVATAARLATALPRFAATDVVSRITSGHGRVTLARNLSATEQAQIAELAIDGIETVTRWRRAYPLGSLAGHAIGTTAGGARGLERAAEDRGAASGTSLGLTLDTGVQHGIETELADAIRRTKARAATGVVMDAATGAIVALASLPSVDPARRGDSDAPDWSQRPVTFGSIMHAFTLAAALDGGRQTLSSLVETAVPLRLPNATIADADPAPHPLTLREAFLAGSNTGAARLAFDGGDRLRATLSKAGALDALRLESGVLPAPRVGGRWDGPDTVQVGLGQGIALSPIQLATALAALVNGGTRVTPALVPKTADIERARAITAETSDRMREVLRLAVTSAGARARLADADGWRVGGTVAYAHTATIHGRAGRRIAAFAGAFPMDRPQFVLVVVLIDPARLRPAGELAGPAAGKIVQRVAPLLGVLPRHVQNAER